MSRRSPTSTSRPRLRSFRAGGLQTSLDSFKINLGLPTEVEVRIDDSPLDQFELNDERLDSHAHAHRGAVAAAACKATSFRAPSWPTWPRKLKAMYDELETIHDQVVAESQRWQKKLDATKKQGFAGPEGAHKKEIFDREIALVGQAQADA